MPRLPKPNDSADADHWGALLNEFLRVSHREDGTLRGTYVVANVKDFGATGDGVTDDRAAIQAAIDNLPAVGGVVFLPPGTYVINSGAVNITKSHVSLIGSGPSQTTIRYNTNGHGIAVQGGFPAPISHIYVGRLRILSTGPSDASLAGRGTIAFDSAKGSVSDSVIEDVFIDGTPITGITLQGARNTVRGVWIRNTGEHGIYVGGNGDGQKILNSRIENPFLFMPHSVADAIKVTQTRDAIIDNVHLVLGSTSSAEGINVEGSNSRVLISNAHILFGGPNQIGLRLSARYVNASNLMVDGGSGFSNSIAVNAGPTAQASRISNLCTVGTWIAAAVVIRTGATDVTLDGAMITSGPVGAYAIHLTDSTRPTIQNSAILAGTHGITLGNSDGARIINNRVLSTVNKIDTSGPGLKDYLIALT
jgi:parallel beta-helix repeat protein